VQPRIWTPPLRELNPSTSLGFEVIDFSHDTLGIDLLPWQQWLFIHALELKPDGNYRFRTIVTLVARQNGKTTALNILALWRLVMDGARVVMGTSTNLDYARKSWLATVNMAKGSAEILPEFKWPETRTNGRETLETTSGAIYGIATARRTGGRSLSVDLLILDEIREHRTWEAWSASSKTTNARPRGQRWAISNMGDDGSVVLNHLQEKALKVIAGEIEDNSLAIFEWSAPPGCDTGDREAWAMANPALGLTIAEETIASDQTTDDEPVFRTEVLCQRVSSLEPLPIDPEAWAALATPVPVSGTPVFFLDCSPNLQSASIAGAVTVFGGSPYVRLSDYRPGVAWVIPRVAELVKKYPGAKWSYESTGPASAFAEQLSGVGVQVEEPLTITDMARGCAHLQRLVDDEAMSHAGDEAVTVALESAVKRDIGDPGLWSWGRRRSAGDISPLVAVTGALWLLESQPPLAFFASRR
jgi:hypothetical protein